LSHPFAAAVAAQTRPASFDAETFAFWTNEVRKTSHAFARGLYLQGGPAFQPEFVYYDQTRGFQAPGTIDESGLPKSGSVNVSVRGQRFRPSVKARQLFENVQSGSLRVDVKQTSAMPGLLETLAWTSVAAVVPNSQASFPICRI
jgi:hypothetical protein